MGRHSNVLASPFGDLIAEVRHDNLQRKPPLERPAPSRPRTEGDAADAYESPFPTRLSSPFASLIADAREESLARRRAATTDGPRNTPRARPGPEPDLILETSAVSAPPAVVGRRRSLLLPASVALHAALVAALIGATVLSPEPLPTPAHGSRVFFVTTLAAPPPPPAPAALVQTPARAVPLSPKEPSKTPAFTAPLEPRQVRPEDERIEPGSSSGELADTEGGVPGGVDGGVPGGVVGAVLGGLPEAPSVGQPLRVGSTVREPRKLRHVEALYPRTAVVARLQGLVVLECVIDPNGRVADVKVLRSVSGLTEAAVDAVRQWVYSPTLVDGAPVAVLMTVTVGFNLKG